MFHSSMLSFPSFFRLEKDSVASFHADSISLDFCQLGSNFSDLLIEAYEINHYLFRAGSLATAILTDVEVRIV
jgi:hypothetical protein